MESPRLSGELLLAHALGLERMDLYLRLDQPLRREELAAFKELILRRRAQEPVAYLLGWREFYGLRFRVGPGVLIPRPETELLVDRGREILAEEEAPRILDLCTGCGCVAIALLTHLPQARAVGVDLSPQALAYARDNAEALGVAVRVEWRQGDLYQPVAAAGGFFELITANPPYVAAGEWDGLPAQVRDYEPRQALVAGPKGLEVIREVIGGAGAFLRAGGWLLVELGLGQAAAAVELARAAGVFEQVETARDLARVERVLCCRRGDYG